MSSSSGRIRYDATDVNSVAASSTVGSHTLAGDGTPITETGGALDVNFASGTVALASEFAEDTAHTTADTGQFIMSVRVDALTAVPATALAGTELDYQALISDQSGALYVAGTQFDIDDLNATDDAVAAHTHDGTGTAITSTGTALDVNIASGDVDDSLANIAIENTTTAISTAAVAVVSSALANRKWLALANFDNKQLFFGKAGLTTVNGFPLNPGERAWLRIGPTPVVEAIGGTGASSEDLRVLELS